jgi:DNA-binding transcriptional regulator YdaS (Cro superfamily)
LEISKVIAALGGNKKLAIILGITPSAVTHWHSRKQFPARRVLEIAALAQAENIMFDAVEFLKNQSTVRLSGATITPDV